jgi:hypothetical protein
LFVKQDVILSKKKIVEVRNEFFISNVPFGFRRKQRFTQLHYTDMKLAVIEPLVFSKFAIIRNRCSN